MNTYISMEVETEERINASSNSYARKPVSGSDHFDIKIYT